MNIVLSTQSAKKTWTVKNLLRELKLKFPKTLLIDEFPKKSFKPDRIMNPDITVILTARADSPCIVFKLSEKISPVYNYLYEKAKKNKKLALLLLPDTLFNCYGLIVLSKALEEYNIRKYHETHIFKFKYKGTVVSLPLKDILFFYTRKGKTHLMYDAGDIEIPGSLSDIKLRLDDVMFIATYKSFMINVSHIKKIIRKKVSENSKERYFAVMSNGSEIPICKNRQHEILGDIDHFGKI